uniref:Uncharacterized protein n=1 Tax=Arundo donax TaxID=35708 RepID=A0A0A9HFD5_ARUDO
MVQSNVVPAITGCNEHTSSEQIHHESYNSSYKNSKRITQNKIDAKETYTLTNQSNMPSTH